MLQKLVVYRLILADAAQRKIAPILAKFQAAKARLMFLIGAKVVASRSLSVASRMSNSGYVEQVRAHWDDFVAAFPSTVSLNVPRWAARDRSIVLRTPGGSGEGSWKGILLIKFTYISSYYFRNLSFQRLTDDYHVFLEPSWMGYCDPDILFWATTGNTVFVQASEAKDRQFLTELSRNLVPVEFGSGNWVDDRIFRPLPGVDARKEFDVVYVSNRGSHKRNHVYFKAVHDAARLRQGFRAAFVCSSWGGRRDVIRDLISHYKVEDCVEVFDSLSHHEVNEVLNRSKCCVLLSRKEGSNRSLFESMFSGTPVILLKENVGVNKAYINSETGAIVPECQFVEGMLEVTANYGRYRPREWAMRCISPHATRRSMVRAIRDAFPDEPISERDIRLKVNGPELRYYDEARPDEHHELVDALLNAYESRNPVSN